MERVIYRFLKMFQLTTSRRGRPFLSPLYVYSACFNSRPHEEVDGSKCTCYTSYGVSTHDLTKRSTRSFCTSACGSPVFQLTTSRRGRRCSATIAILHISMFQLTTSRRGRLLVANWVECHKRFNSRPHEEVDCYTNMQELEQERFNSRPHEEVD